MSSLPDSCYSGNPNSLLTIYIYIYTHIYIYIHKYYISMWTHKGMDIMVPPVNFLMISYDCYQALLGLG